MKLHFDSNQDYQLHTIQSVVDVFEGQPMSMGEFEFSLGGALTQDFEAAAQRNQDGERLGMQGRRSPIILPLCYCILHSK